MYREYDPVFLNLAISMPSLAVLSAVDMTGEIAEGSFIIFRLIHLLRKAMSMA